MECIRDAGAQYGVKFNWANLEAMFVRCQTVLQIPGGDHVKEKTEMKYLGSVVSADGKIGPELNARLGAARSEFAKLCTVWAHILTTKCSFVLDLLVNPCCLFGFLVFFSALTSTT